MPPHHRFCPTPPPCLAFTLVLGSEFRSSRLCNRYLPPEPAPQPRYKECAVWDSSASLMGLRKWENCKEPLLFQRPDHFFKDSYFLNFLRFLFYLFFQTMYFDHISPLWLLLNPPHLPTHPTLFSLSKNRKTHQTSKWTNKRPVRQNITRQSKTVHKNAEELWAALQCGWHTQWHPVGENGFFPLCQLVSTAHGFKVYFPLLVLEPVCLEPVQVLCAAVNLYVCISPAVPGRHCVLGVTHPRWLLQSLHLCVDPWALRRGSVKSFHLGFCAPRSLLCKHCPV